jgi:uncharacterized sulfatase
VLWGYLPKKYTIYTELLEKNGYFTGYTGKGWAPGNNKVAGRELNPAGRDYNKIRQDPIPGLTKYKSGINDIDNAANFKSFIDEKPEGQPFCFWFGAIEPHRIYSEGIGKRAGKNPDHVVVPDFLPDDSIVRNDIADYLFEVEWFDSHMDRMLKLLEERGEMDNTLVVMTSDNGMPFPRLKSNLYI